MVNNPTCRRCKTPETRCAYVGGCCPACTHFGWLDADGNDPHAGISGPIPVACDDCRRIRRACPHRDVA